MRCCIKDPSKSKPFQIGTDQDGILGLFIIGIGKEADDAKRFLVSGSIRAKRDESHLSRIVNLRHARQKLVRKLPNGHEHAHADILRVHAIHVPRVEPLILGPDRADEDLASIRELVRLLPLGRIGPDGARHGRMDGRIFDLDPRVERDHALLIDQERIDIELANGAVLHGKRTQSHKAKREPVAGRQAAYPGTLSAICRSGSNG